MSEDTNTSGKSTTGDLNRPPVKRRGSGPGMGAIPAEKPKNFRQALGRLLKIFFSDKLRTVLLLAFLLLGAVLNSYGPKALGNATNVLFEGLISKQVTAQIEATGAPIDVVKQTVDNADGTMNVDRFTKMIENQQRYSAPETGEQAEPMDIGSIKQMLAQMKITLGEGVNFGLFGYTLALVIIVYLFSFFARWIAGWISVRMISNASQTLRQQIEEKIWRLPLSYYDKTSRGEIMSRTTNDLDNITQTLNQTGGDLIYLSLMVASIIVMMFTVSPLLAVIALLTVPVSFGIIALIMKKSGPQFKKQWATTGSLNSHIEEAFTGHLIIKAYGQQDEFKRKFDIENESLYDASFKAQFISGMIMPVMTFMTNLNYVVIAFIGALRVLNGQMSLGDVQAFVQYSRNYSQPLTQISQMVNMLQSGAASAERIFDLLDAKEESDEHSKIQDYPVKQGLIEFKNVDFSYTDDTELIQNMNLVANPGQTVAIVGPTGAGKTTLVNLIMRFYDIDDGEILLDGTNIRDISRQALRKNVGMVLQDTWLFKGTIEENLKYGAPEGVTISDETFMAATKATYVDHFVKALPDGYKTVLDDEGSQISVGEKQLLTIARAFLANPDILILDEATSSVDTRTEVLVQKAMNALRSNRTSFVIAHRLSTIRDADTIIVMEKGSIVEQGNHDELIAKGGHYAALYQSQFENAELDEEGHGESIGGQTQFA